LQEPVQAETGPERLTRRQVAQKLTLAGASLALVPLVTSVLAPTPAMAQSSVTQAQAEQDLIKVIEEAGSNLSSNTTAQNELANAAAAYSKGDYNSELADLEGVLDTLGLPPL